MGGGGKLKSSFTNSPNFTFTDKVLAQGCSAHFKRAAKQGFTLAEVLITLAIIGVVAAMTIPSVIVNTNQAEFKTGLRKAVSVLNSAITMNKALTGESPYDNGDLFNYLQQHMAVLDKMSVYPNRDHNDAGGYNIALYTTDGIRYEISYEHNKKLPLYENPNIKMAMANYPGVVCGSMGLAHNPDGTTAPPCLMSVDVNGERKPNIFKDSKCIKSEELVMDVVNYSCISSDYKFIKSDPNGRLLTDTFTIMITDQGAIPYGIVAQKAMYQAQK